MADYQAPLRDMRFVLNEVFDPPSLWASLPKIAENVDPDTADAILEEAGKITSGVLAPLNREADEQGCKWNDGEVTSPEGFKEAYQTIVEGGWNGLSGNPEFGRSEEHTSELQSRENLVCRLLLEQKKQPGQL